MIKTLVLALSLGSPAVFADTPEMTFTTKDVLADTFASPRQRAEKLARIGEALMMPQSIDFATEVFNAALELDRANPRANFYLRLFGPLRTARGFMTRIQPLIESTREDHFVQNYYRDLNNAWPYLRAGEKDIKTDAELRDWLDQLGESWGRAREYFATDALPIEIHTTWLTTDYRREVRDPILTYHYDEQKGWVSEPSGEFTTRMDTLDGNDLAAHFCKADSPAPGVYHVEACPHLTVKTYAVDFADLEALRGYAAGHQLLGLADTAYNTDGLIKAMGYADTSLRKGHEIVDRELIEMFKSAGAGALIHRANLERVKELGTDVFSGVKWLMKSQTELCQERPGFLFAKGICLTNQNFTNDDLTKALALVETTLGGGAIETSSGHGRRTKVNLSRIYEAPVENLTFLVPTSFDGKGYATDLPDPTLNGIFPAADAPAFYRLGGR